MAEGGGGDAAHEIEIAIVFRVIEPAAFTADDRDGLGRVVSDEYFRSSFSDVGVRGHGNRHSKAGDRLIGGSDFGSSDPGVIEESSGYYYTNLRRWGRARCQARHPGEIGSMLC